MTAMQSGRGLDHWPVQLLSGMLTDLSKRLTPSDTIKHADFEYRRAFPEPVSESKAFLSHQPGWGWGAGECSWNDQYAMRCARQSVPEEHQPHNAKNHHG
jgi:hypothetical protein